MKDCHVHLQGNYTIDNINKIVFQSIKMNINEIWLLEHTYMFKEYLKMYDFLGEKNYIWFSKKIQNSKQVSEYHKLIKEVRKNDYPITIKFGLEVCYKKEKGEFIKEIKESFDYDFLIGSIHYIDDFAFARKFYLHSYENYNIDNLYKKYFEDSIDLIKSKLFNVIAHPDLIKLRGYTPSFELDDFYSIIIEEAFKNKVALEQNSGINRKFNCELGMNKKMLAIALLNGVEIKTSSDAHAIEDIGYKIDLMTKEIERSKKLWI